MENALEKLARVSDSDPQAVVACLLAVAASVGGAVLLTAIAF